MIDLAASWGYSGLFIMAFLAATLVPLSSEALLALLLTSGELDPILLVAVASLGNSLGSCVNYALGRYCQHFKDRKWFPASADQIEKAQKRFERWGILSLLLSWVPIIGDPITVVAGFLKVRFWAFAVIVAIAKTGRYLAVAFGAGLLI